MSAAPAATPGSGEAPGVPDGASAAGARRLEGQLVRLTRAATVALASLYLAMLAYHATAVIVFPYDLNYGEGYVLNDALRLVRGEPVYTDIRQFPMVRSPYPPLFLLLDGLATSLLGGGLLAGRLLAALAGLASGSLLFLAAYRLSGQKFVAFACAALYLGSPFLYQWIAFSRVDLAANTLSLLAVVLLVFSTSWRTLLLAAVLCALSMLTKQTAFAATAAIVLWLLPWRPRRAAAFFLVASAPVAAVTALLAVFTDGQYWIHVWQGNAANPFHVGRMAAFEGLFFLLHPVLVVGVGWAGYCHWRGRSARQGATGRGRWAAPATLVALYAAVALATTLAAGNEGSSVNYFLEFLAAGVLAVAMAWVGVARTRPAATAGVPVALLLLQFGLYAHVPNLFGVWYPYAPPHGFTPTTLDYAVGARLDELISSRPGKVLLEAAGLAVRNGKEVLVQPIDLRAEQLHGRWQPDELNRAINQHEFDLIVRSFDLLPRDVQAEVERSYRLMEQLEGSNRLIYKVYAPRQGSEADSPLDT